MTHPLIAAFREARKAQGLTQSQVATLANTDRTSIVHFECQRAGTMLAKYDRWFGVLGLELIAVSTDPVIRAEEVAGWLRERGWTVEAPSARGDFW